MVFNFLFREGIKNILRNKASFFLSVSVSAVCLLLLSIFLLLTINIFRTKNSIEERIEIYTFLTDDADKDKLIDKISQINGVKQIKYVSKEAALEELRADLAENKSLIDILQRNPLPASLRIQVTAGYKLPTKLAEIEEKIRLLKGIREIWSGKDLLSKLQKYLQIITMFDIGILMTVLIAVIFIISRTVEATIVSKAREIEIMRLVGASSSMVKFPFYIEGFIHGLLGSIVSFIIVVIIFYFVSTAVPLFYAPYFSILIFSIIFGAGLGIGGSYIALSRVLK